MEEEKKKISIMIPCFNEEENVVAMSNAVVDIVTKELPQYDYELLFIDNDSTDNTRPLIREICKKNPKVKATITMCCDFQDPVEMIPVFVHEWEKGAKIVCGIKATSKENKFMRFLRTCYYKLIKKMSSVEQIEHFTGFGLYDKSFIEVLKNLNDPTPFLRGIVAELGFKRKDVVYEQQKRRAGKTHNNFFTLYDAAMLSFTSYTKAGLRAATIIGFIASLASFIIGIVYLILKLIYWDRFPAGIAPLIIVVCFLGSLQLFFIGFLGEYIMAINQRVMHRPLVIEEERINFDDNTPKNTEK